MKTKNSGKQRKMLYNAPLHKKRKEIAAHLEENLLLKYDRRSLPVIEGDTVRVLRGSFKGHEDKVVGVNVKKRFIEIEGITLSKADGNKIPKPIHPSNVLITKLNLTDKWRRGTLERELSEDTRKEIEKEAEEQIKEAEMEAERKRKEQEKLEKQKEEEEAKKEEEIKEEKETPKEKEKTDEKEKKEKPATKEPKKKEEKKETKKPKPKPKKQEKKKTQTTKKKQKKSSTKKKTSKKTQKKKTNKKEGGK